MAPSREKSKDESQYAWTRGGMRGVTHEGLIAIGGFGEVS